MYCLNDSSYNNHDDGHKTYQRNWIVIKRNDIWFNDVKEGE